MNKSITTFCISILVVAFLLPINTIGQSSRLWGTYYGGTNTHRAIGIATDASGNVYMLGREWDVTDYDLFLVKFNSSGVLQWERFIGGDDSEFVYGNGSITIDPSGNIYICGYSDETIPEIDSSPGIGTLNTHSELNPDAFLLKYDPSGNIIWGTYYEGNDEVKGIAVNTDAIGNVYMAGNTVSTINMATAGAHQTSFASISANHTDVFLVKFNSNGARQWATYYGGDMFDEVGYQLPIDNAGNVYLIGSTASNLPAASISTINTSNIGSGNERDLFIAKFNSSGVRQWGRYYGGTSADFGYGAALDAYGNVYVAGQTTSTTDIATAGAHQITRASTFDGFISKFDASDGSLVWGTYFGGNTNDGIRSMHIDALDNLYVRAGVQSTDTWLPASGGFQSTLAGGSESYIATFDLNGVLQCASYIGGTGNETYYGISSDGIGNVYVSGETASTNNISTAGSHQVTNGGGKDAYLIKYGGCGPDTTFICSGDSILLDGAYQHVSGNYGGIELFVNPSTTGVDVQTACNTFTWIDGVTYTSNNTTATDTVFGGSANGCDSIVTLNLTITPTTTGIDLQTACNTFTWIDGVIYTSNNTTATDTIFGGASNGCDSIVTLNLTITPSATGVDVQTACNTFTWIDGVTYTSNNTTATDTVFGGASNGCDSIVTLNLTINQAVTVIDVQTACNTFTWIDGVTYTSNNTTATDTVFGGSANGCDSIVTLNLTILTPTKTTTVLSECEGFTVTVGTNTYTSSGIFTDIVNNCDTIITDLTINPAPTFTIVKTNDNCGEEIGSIVTNIINATPPIIYNWSNGSTGSEINNLPIGNYTVIVTDSSGCSMADTISIVDLEIDCDFFVYLPNAFTPNGDGNNDVFLVRGKGIETLSVSIYNRWGNKVFETEDEIRGWDGTYKGSEQNSGVFVFIVQGTFVNGKAFKESGDVELIR